MGRGGGGCDAHGEEQRALRGGVTLGEMVEGRLANVQGRGHSCAQGRGDCVREWG